MAWDPPTPRCLAPMRYYDYPGRADFDPVCWRPAGHPNPGRHLSKWAYLNQRERTAAWQHANRGRNVRPR